MAIRKIISRSITDGAVVATDVAALSIDSTKLASNAVTNAKIASNAISSDKLDTNIQFGFKNRIINGDMRIDQRNAGASLAVGTGNEYSLDRWRSVSSQSSKMTYQRNAGAVTPPVGFTNYLGITTTAGYTVGSGERFHVRQSIEGYNVADLAWGTSSALTVTLSFWVRSSLTGTFGGSLANGNADRSYPFSYTISSANTWEKKTITVAGDTTGTWATDNSSGLILYFGLGVGSTLSGTAGTWAGADYRSSTGAVSVVGTTGATWYITGVQLEVGASSTPFDTRAYGTELALCQRYYQYHSRYFSVASAGQRCWLGVSPVVLRATPSITSGSIDNIENGSTVIASPSYGGIEATGNAWTNQLTGIVGVLGRIYDLRISAEL